MKAILLSSSRRILYFHDAMTAATFLQAYAPALAAGVFAAAGAAGGAAAGAGWSAAGGALGALVGAALFLRRPAPPAAAEPALEPAPPQEAPPPPPPVSPLVAEAALRLLPAAAIVVDAELRVRRINAEAMRILVEDDRPEAAEQAIGQHLVSLVRAPGLISAAEDALADGVPRTLPVTLLKARTERALIAHFRALGAADVRGPAALIVIEDQTRIRQIEEMRQDFIANASHELKTPLASIIGFIETLQGPAKDDAEARARFLGIMASQAERMKRLVEDLMSLSRIEMNAHVRPTGDVDLGAVAHSVAAALEPVAREAKAKLVVVAPQSGPIVSGDPDQIAQLITNLIDNAVKYGGEGVTVTVSAAEPTPERPQMVGVTVTDDGPGIAREHLPRLTERFYRVSAARSRAVGGTGLGLAIAKHILQRHRGDLQVRSRLGEGSAFTIWLPKRADSAPPRIS